MLYFDTSFLAPLILEEETSGRIERFIGRLPAGELAISHWTRVEFSSLLAREVRMGGLRPREAEAADLDFETIISESFVVLVPEAEDFDLAKEFLRRHSSGLRAGDALHLAVARHRDAKAVYSLDRTMIKAGRALGLPMSKGL
jgi:predicted nucleic acid-binding protein